MNRRSAVTAVSAVVAAPFINRGRFRLFAQSDSQYSARTVEVIGRSLVLDMCGGPAAPEVRKKWRSKKGSITAEELARLKGSGISVWHPAEGWPAESTKRFINEWNSLIAQYDTLFVRVDGISDLERAKTSGRMGVIVGTQNSEHFQLLDDVAYFYELGQRVSQLTYNYRNFLGDGCMEQRPGGLSAFGIRVVQRMNELGMAIDVSHCGDMTTLDAFEASRRPVLITHSNCRALVQGHVRCKSDEAIKKMAATGGVMGITLLRMMVRAEEPTTIEHVLDHYDHVAKLVGKEHLGLGTDWAVVPRPQQRSPEELKAALAKNDPQYRMRDKIAVDGINYQKTVYDLVEGFLRRNYTNADIEGILGANFQRALSRIWL